MALPRFSFSGGATDFFQPNQALFRTTFTPSDKLQSDTYQAEAKAYQDAVEKYNEAIKVNPEVAPPKPTPISFTQEEFDQFGVDASRRAQQLQNAKQNAFNAISNPRGFSQQYGIGSLGFEDGGAVGEGIASLRPSETSMGLAPYGVRHSGEGLKGKGYFGEIQSPSGQSVTEYSLYDEDIGEYPSIVPTLTAEELQDTIRRSSQGEQPSAEVIMKARMYAKDRLSEGKSTFSGPTELRLPVPSNTDDDMIRRIDAYLEKNRP
jgi:hypothetical protein